MNHEAKLVALEINPIIADPKPLQNSAGPLELAELIDLGIHDLLRQAAKFAKNLQLQFLRHSCQFGSARRVKNDLERAHLSTRSLPELLCRTRWKCLPSSESAVLGIILERHSQ